MQIKNITSISELEAETRLNQNVVIDVWAEWCGPCRIMSPVFESLATEPNNVQVQFLKVDAESSNDLIAHLGVKAIPTFIKFENGRIVNSATGSLPKEKLKRMFNI